MKKITLFCLAALFAVAVAGCSKERVCQCSVMGESYVRTIKIDKGTCDDLRFVIYDLHPVLYPDQLDSVLCTDFDFDSYEQ